MTRERDPADEWLWAVPLTDEQLAADRERIRSWHTEHFGPAPERFTCDDCAMAPRCSLAFDSYNTEGDCLYDK